MALYFVGDVQGCYDELRTLLDLASFNPEEDELWLTGDLVARGPKSLDVLRFVMSLGDRATTVLGNHDLHLLATAAGYAKFETFPVWNLPLTHPVNIAYEAATADLDDANIIDSFHLEAYNKTTVNYNRDVEAFPVVRALMEKILGKSPYQSPTDMGVNMVGFAITDDDACRDASKMEIVRRYFTAVENVRRTGVGDEQVDRLKIIMKKAGVDKNYSPARSAAKPICRQPPTRLRPMLPPASASSSVMARAKTKPPKQ